VRRLAGGFAALLVLTALLALAGAAAAKKKPKEPKLPPSAPAVDSVTTGLWNFDENGGPLCSDAGPFRMRGTAGEDTRTEFGRYRSARIFTRTKQSWVFVPYNPEMDIRSGFTIEAWIYTGSWAVYELQSVAARWSPLPGAQSWLLGVSGEKQKPPLVPAGPGMFASAVTNVPSARLVFVMQPAEAAAASAYASVGSLPLGRWVHVAATVDGSIVRLYIDGRMDSQYASRQTLRASLAPLVIGGIMDERRLSDLGGHLELESGPDYSSFYGFEGLIDEVRLSNTARTRFESIDTR
jgi:hypothetical protein